MTAAAAAARSLLSTALAAALLIPSLAAAEGRRQGHRDVLGPRFEASRDSSSHHDKPRGRSSDVVRRWNRIAIDASGLDHTPVAEGETRVFGEQLGPTRASRAMAIVHIAVFDAVNAITGGYRSYTGLSRAPYGTSFDAAVATAAHDTLVALFPSQAESFDDALADELARIRDRHARAKGIALGQRAAAAILALREKDGSHHDEPLMNSEYVPKPDPGWWRRFGSAELVQLIESAERNNRDLAAAGHRIAQARANLRVAQSALLPSVDASGSAGRSGAEGRGPSSSFQAGFGASYEIDVWGRNRASRDAAAAALASSGYARETARISVEELAGMMRRGDDPVVLDVRTRSHRRADGRRIPGARAVDPEAWEDTLAGVVRTREVVVYCACPNEATAAKVALALRARGFHRVRPLAGGIEAWADAGNAVDSVPVDD